MARYPFVPQNTISKPEDLRFLSPPPAYFYFFRRYTTIHDTPVAVVAGAKLRNSKQHTEETQHKQEGEHTERNRRKSPAPTLIFLSVKKVREREEIREMSRPLLCVTHTPLSKMMGVPAYWCPYTPDGHDASLALPPTAVLGVMYSYIMSADVRTMWLESVHFRQECYFGEATRPFSRASTCVPSLRECLNERRSCIGLRCSSSRLTVSPTQDRSVKVSCSCRCGSRQLEAKQRSSERSCALGGLSESTNAYEVVFRRAMEQFCLLR